jgi:hypothetical protein
MSVIQYHKKQHVTKYFSIFFLEMDILGSLSEDDPRLIQIIRNWFLEPPPSKSSEGLLRISNTLLLYSNISLVKKVSTFFIN